jgi:hypothetical protein
MSSRRTAADGTPGAISPDAPGRENRRKRPLHPLAGFGGVWRPRDQHRRLGQPGGDARAHRHRAAPAICMATAADRACRIRPSPYFASISRHFCQPSTAGASTSKILCTEGSEQAFRKTPKPLERCERIGKASETSGNRRSCRFVQTAGLTLRTSAQPICKCTSLPSAAMLKPCSRLALFSWISTAP